MDTGWTYLVNQTLFMYIICLLSLSCLPGDLGRLLFNVEKTPLCLLCSFQFWVSGCHIASQSHMNHLSWILGSWRVLFDGNALRALIYDKFSSHLQNRGQQEISEKRYYVENLVKTWIIEFKPKNLSTKFSVFKWGQKDDVVTILWKHNI